MKTIVEINFKRWLELDIIALAELEKVGAEMSRLKGESTPDLSLLVNVALQRFTNDIRKMIEEVKQNNEIQVSGDEV